MEVLGLLGDICFDLKDNVSALKYYEANLLSQVLNSDSYSYQNILTKIRKIDPEEDMPPYEDPGKVFPKRDHELVLKAFRNCGGKMPMVY